jgi:hypothetical protein
MAAEPATSDLHNDVETNAVDPKETPENYAALPKHDRPSLYTILTCSLTQVLSMLFVKLLMHPCIYIAWKAIGVIFCEWPLNFLVFNNGIFVLFFRLVTFRWSTDPPHCPHCFWIVSGLVLIGFTLCEKLGLLWKLD